jgi:hypothetical protein
MANVSDGPTPQDVEWDESQQEKAVQSVNGLQFINGLHRLNGSSQVNGLRLPNGLRQKNGLRLKNGVEHLTGLSSTYNNATTVNGKAIDCRGKTLGVSCTGEPDGLLSSSTGLMSSAEGVEVAKYVVRCALGSGDGIRVKQYDGSLVTLRGAIGLAPRWKHEDCDKGCQERITACLLALTNGDARNVGIEMSAPSMSRLGGGHGLPDQEAAFFGNLFAERAVAYVCMGTDAHAPRMAEGYTDTVHGVGDIDYGPGGLTIDLQELASWDLPYYLVGYCGKRRANCAYQGSEPTECTGEDGQRYRNVITTYRRLDATNVKLGAASYYASRCARNPGDARACDWDYPAGWSLRAE